MKKFYLKAFSKMPLSCLHDAIKTVLKNFIGGIFKNAIMMPL